VAGKFADVSRWTYKYGFREVNVVLSDNGICGKRITKFEDLKTVKKGNF